jgi:hypothetical protein
MERSMELTTDAMLGIGACLVVIALIVWSYRERL